jgi:hypothetical protein
MRSRTGWCRPGHHQYAQGCLDVGIGQRLSVALAGVGEQGDGVVLVLGAPRRDARGRSRGYGSRVSWSLPV